MITFYNVLPRMKIWHSIPSLNCIHFMAEESDKYFRIKFSTDKINYDYIQDENGNQIVFRDITKNGMGFQFVLENLLNNIDFIKTNSNIQILNLNDLFSIISEATLED